MGRHFVDWRGTVCLRLEVVGDSFVGIVEGSAWSERKANRVERRSKHLKRSKVLETCKLEAVCAGRETRVDVAVRLIMNFGKSGPGRFSWFRVPKSKTIA